MKRVLAIFLIFCSCSSSLLLSGSKWDTAVMVVTFPIWGSVALSNMVSNTATSALKGVSHVAAEGAKDVLENLAKNAIKSSVEDMSSSKAVDLVIKKVAISSMSFATGMAGLFASEKIFVDGTREYTEAKKNNNQSLKKQAKIKMVSSACGFALTPPFTIAAIAKGLKQ